LAPLVGGGFVPGVPLELDDPPEQPAEIIAINISNVYVISVANVLWQVLSAFDIEPTTPLAHSVERLKTTGTPICDYLMVSGSRQKKCDLVLQLTVDAKANHCRHTLYYFPRTQHFKTSPIGDKKNAIRRVAPGLM
jgi:hypothetical protein